MNQIPAKWLRMLGEVLNQSWRKASLSPEWEPPEDWTHDDTDHFRESLFAFLNDKYVGEDWYAKAETEQEVFNWMVKDFMIALLLSCADDAAEDEFSTHILLVTP